MLLREILLPTTRGRSKCQRRQPDQNRIRDGAFARGQRRNQGYLVRPAKATGKLPGILVIHENRGLNPYIEDVARRLGTDDFMAFAPDGLTSVGGYPGDDEHGAAMFGNGRPDEDERGFRRCRRVAEGAPRLHRQDRRVGFCFGGGVVNIRWRSGSAPTCRRGGAVLRRAASRPTSHEDQGAAPAALRGA